MKKVLFFLMISCGAFQSNLLLAQSESFTLKGHHTIFFEGGVKTNSNSTVSITSGTIEAKTGFLGGVNYGYWFSEEWELTAGAKMFGSATTVKLFNIETSSVIPVLVGIRFYPQALAIGEIGRAYAGISLGAYFGSATQTKGLFHVENIEESVFGGEAVLGLDFFVAPWCKVGPQFSFLFLDDYKQILGLKKNLSGVAFCLEFGFVL
jgi:hypothetical protein